MIRYIGRRLILFVPALLGISLVTFIVLRLIPGDPVQVILGEHATAEQIARFRVSSGLDQPLPVQYLRYLGNLLRGDWGRAIQTNRPVLAELAGRLPATIELSLAAMVLACAVGVPAGVVAAQRRHSWADRFASAISLTGVSAPLFWVGLLLIYLFGYRLGWFPPSGRLTLGGDLRSVTGFYLLDAIVTLNPRGLADVLHHLALPALTLSIVPLAVIVRMTRAILLETLGQDHVRTARAKGLPERIVLLRHALRSAAPPLLTVIGLQLGNLFGGAVVTETIFSWPGMGQLVVERVLSRDYPMMQGLVVAVAALIVLINLATDILCSAVDPRVRYA